MKIKDFKKLVKEIVKQEMITQKEQILMEIKAELFDIMSTQKTSNTEKSSKINEGAEVSRASLRRMFEENLGTNNDVFLNNICPIDIKKEKLINCNICKYDNKK